MTKLSENQPHPRPPIKAYKVGKRNAKGRLEPAFVIAKRPNGGIAMHRMKVQLSSSEKHTLFAHFGNTYEIRTGGRTTDGRDVQMMKSVVPGDQDHFTHASMTLPAPWSVMGVANV